MKRNREFPQETFDVLVIGGGFHGAAAANKLADAGYKTILFEQNDFCSATSTNSLKILHGGLRYLQHGNIHRMRESILSRREIAQKLPHLTRPLPCIMPTNRQLLRSRFVMETAIRLNDIISRDRNKGVAPATALPSGKTLSKVSTARILRDAFSDSMTGAALWYDLLAVSTERIVMEYLLEAAESGASIYNYCRVESVQDAGDKYTVTVIDQVRQESHTVSARIIINAAGPWLENAAGYPSGGEKQKWAIALNIISRKQIFSDYAVALEGISEYKDRDSLLQSGKRLYFFVPWRGHTMIGTEYILQEPPDTALHVPQEMIERMAREINKICPHASLQYRDISFYHAGLVPAQSCSTTSDIQLEKHSTIQKNIVEPARGILSIRGVKYTTAPQVASELVRIIRKDFPDIPPRTKLPEDHSVTSEHPLIPSELSFLTTRYGVRAIKILEYIDEQENLFLDKERKLLSAEIRYFIDRESALHLDDILFRRTDIGTAGYPGEKTVNRIAGFMGSILNWDEQQIAAETATVTARYQPLLLAGES